MDLKIDPEFQQLLPPLSPIEIEELKQNIETNGCLNAIIVWANHDDIIIDGHHRYAICKELGVKFKVDRRSFDSREDVLKWIYQFQQARRNLTNEQLSLIRGMVYEARKKTKGGDRNPDGRKGKESKGQNDPLISTAEIVAEEFGVSEKTIKRDAAFARTVNAETDPEKKAELLKGKSAMKKKKSSANHGKNGKSRKTQMDVWRDAFEKAALIGKPLSNEWFEHETGSARTYCSQILGAAERSVGFRVRTANKKADKIVERIRYVVDDSVDSENLGLLLTLKKLVDKTIKNQNEYNGINFPLVWNALLDAQRLLKDLTAAKTQESL